MKPLFLLFASSVICLGQEISYFNRGLLRQGTAALDRAYLGIVTSGSNGISITVVSPIVATTNNDLVTLSAPGLATTFDLTTASNFLFGFSQQQTNGFDTIVDVNGKLIWTNDVGNIRPVGTNQLSNFAVGTSYQDLNPLATVNFGHTDTRSGVDTTTVHMEQFSDPTATNLSLFDISLAASSNSAAFFTPTVSGLFESSAASTNAGYVIMQWLARDSLNTVSLNLTVAPRNKSATTQLQLKTNNVSVFMVDINGVLTANAVAAGVITNGAGVANRLAAYDGNNPAQLISAAASGAVPIDADGTATTGAQIVALIPGQIHTNGYAASLPPASFSNNVVIDAAHHAAFLNITASRMVITDGGSALTNATASGAVPIDADGTATTAGQINTLFGGQILTNDWSASAPAVVLSNTSGTRFAQLFPNHVAIIDAGQFLSQSPLGAVPIDGDTTATTFPQIQALAPGQIWTNGNSVAGTFSNNMTVDDTHTFYASDTTNKVNWQIANYVLTANDTFVLMTGAHTATLPSASAQGAFGKSYWIQCASAGTNAILRAGSDTINGPFGQGLTKITNTAIGKGCMLYSNGTNWWGFQF